MAKLRSNLTRIVVLVVVVAVVAGGALYLFKGSSSKTVKARFAAAVGVYPGTPVKMLGVKVGDVTSVKPQAGYVEIGMEYDSQYSVPANATATEVANSLVSDRYIDLTPYSGSGPKMANGAAIPPARTSAPAELDDIYKALNTLSVALGPKGANKNGALSTLLKVGAANLKGNGAALGNSIEKLSQAASTLSNGRKDLFGTVSNLSRFTKALSDSDGQVRLFNSQLAQVAGDLANERTDLGGALQQLGLALDKVNQFVKKNASKFHTDISGLREITNVLVKQKSSINEALAIAPAALANVVHSYQPDLGVIASRGNLSSLTDPGQLCAIITVLTDKVGSTLGLGTLLGSLTSTIVSTCKGLVKGSPDLQTLVGTLLMDPGIGDLAGKLKGVLGVLGSPIGATGP
ncbi:MAG: MCE family protein [Jatrophihabitans sp.]